mmetsp:Transcript_18071/g.20745  ORF Transcript_18071/g.20745 Transcript_18071/m.20745 type:complete len:224 (+) Transcript_18071:317-988(+)
MMVSSRFFLFDYIEEHTNTSDRPTTRILFCLQEKADNEAWTSLLCLVQRAFILITAVNFSERKGADGHDRHAGIQLLHPAVLDGARRIPPGTLHNEAVNMATITSACLDLVNRLLEHIDHQRHLIKVEAVDHGSCLHDGRQEGHRVEKEREVCNLGGLQVNEPRQELLVASVEVLDPATQRPHRHEGHLGPHFWNAIHEHLVEQLLHRRSHRQRSLHTKIKLL